MSECEAVIAEARSWIATPYRHQASLKGVGCDCLGLIRGVYRALCGPEPEPPPPYTPNWAETGGDEALAKAAARHLVAVPLAHAGPGDVLLFRWRRHLPAKHAAIITSPQRMIHAQDGAGVCEVVIAEWWWRHAAFAFRFPRIMG